MILLLTKSDITLATRVEWQIIPPYGRLEEFSPDVETFESYSERVELFLEAHTVPEDRKVAVVLNAIGVKNYSLLRGPQNLAKRR